MAVSDRYQKLAAEIEQYARSHFGDSVKVRTLNEPYGFELTIKPNLNSEGYVPRLVEINIYEEAIFMLVDDYRWEFDDKIDDARTEIKSYLTAIERGRLREKKIRILGITFNSRLIIEP